MIIISDLLVRTLAAASLLLTSSAFATAYYVSPTGSDNNNGAPSKPLATIMKAESLASSGDTIYLNTGTYNVANSYHNCPGIGGTRTSLGQ